MAKQSRTKKTSRWSLPHLRDVLRFRWLELKGDWRRALLWIIELILAVILAAAIAIYLDPDVNIVPYPWNGIAFLAILGAAVYVHGFTRPYRMARRIAAARLN